MTAGDGRLDRPGSTGRSAPARADHDSRRVGRFSPAAATRRRSITNGAVHRAYRRPCPRNDFGSGATNGESDEAGFPAFEAFDAFEVFEYFDEVKAERFFVSSGKPPARR
ncbi:hypothetical protein [Kitasatospora sp. NPDC087314]|uniref:hypothetical protein n=1 Tax=Kitasatospora sp. NPDC087314 TaxID=3364068 RepID=UPI003814970D